MPRGASVSVSQTKTLGEANVSEEMFLAQADATADVEDRGVSPDGLATQHKRPGTVVMYKPMAGGGWTPRTVSVSAIRMNLANGWQQVCPDCGRHHLDRNGNDTTDPNACAAREPVAVRVCPIASCRKRIYDTAVVTEVSVQDDDDPNVIKDDGNAYESTPATRTQMKLNLHLWTRHPLWAQTNGVPPLPSAFEETLDPGARHLG